MTEFQPFPILQTQRLILRELNKQDWQAVSFLRSSEAVNRYVDRPRAETKEAAISFIKKIQYGVEIGDSIYWSLCLKDYPGMIGSICLWNFSADRKVAEIGFDLMPDYQGKGLMNEAVREVIGYGFYNLKLHLIEAYTHIENDASINLLKRNHFVLNEAKEDPDNKSLIIFELSTGIHDGITNSETNIY